MVRIQVLIGRLTHCSVEKMEDVMLIERILRKAAKMMDLTLLETVSHKFTPQGMTAVVLLAESHIAVHTYPEENTIFVDMASCGCKDAKMALEFMGDMLEGKVEIVMDKIIGGA
ncbi:MAG: adenosylmethionine decarboxylase [Euryarchaeota archaeon]|nr:adenosylmethionine decarboxylase [Euryarchaeota archaeon]